MWLPCLLHLSYGLYTTAAFIVPSRTANQNAIPTSPRSTIHPAATAPFKKRKSIMFSTNDSNNNSPSRIDLNEHPSLYRIRLPRAPGIEWGTDLSFSFVYVRGMEPAGPADMSGIIQVGHQICEVCAILDEDDESTIGSCVNVMGAPFDAVMNAFATLDRNVKEVELVFFAGSKEELIAACQGEDAVKEEEEPVVITVIEHKYRGTDNKNTPKPQEEKKDSDDDTITKIHKITTQKGANLRKTLVDNDINVYQSFTRWTNCKGKQLCGTCIVNVSEGSEFTSRKSMDEASTLRENPENYRLSCVTFVYGDVTVETFPPVKASQWTR